MKHLALVICIMLLVPAAAAFDPNVYGEPVIIPAGITPVLKNATNPDSSLSDLAEVEEFFDQLMPANLARYNVVGASVAVISDGNVILAKGYGYSDIANRTPVDATTTAFRIGSITKLFTWTLVMQLVDEGKIDLDADVNTYLKDMKIPDTYPGKPVTMRHLMTHSAGFEDDTIHQEVLMESDLSPFRQYCAENIPARVNPPGKVSSYSNYGTTLAAVIVEDITGVPFEQQLQSRILDPLGMARTSILEDLPPVLAANLTKGFESAGSKNVPVRDAIIVVAPAATVSSTAPDMTRFMIAHMQGGRYGNATILSKPAADLMHARAFANDPRISGMCLGFYENTYNGLRTIGHDGDTTLFHAKLVLIPEKQTGFIVMYNSPGGGSARNEVFEQFMDHYYPMNAVALPAYSPADVARLQKYTGTYDTNRRSFTRFEKYLLPTTQYEVTVAPDGTLILSGKALIDSGDGNFVKPDGTRPATGSFVFHTGPDGSADYFTISNSPYLTFDRVPWYETHGFLDNLKAAAGIIIATVLIWPLLYVFRCTHGITVPAAPKPAVAARWTAGAAALLLLLFVLVILPPFSSQEMVDIYLRGTGPAPAVMVAGLTLTVIAAMLTLMVVVFAVLAWKVKFWTPLHRVHYTVVTIALLAMLYWLHYWNLWVFCL